MKRLYLVLTFAILSCTHTKYSSAPATQVLSIRSNEVKIVLKNGTKYLAKDISTVKDSLFWTSVGTNRVEGVRIVDIDRIVIKKRARGALEGFGIGVLSGFLFGSMIGVSMGDDEIFSAGEQAAMGGFLFGIIGGVIGIPAGALAGEDVIYFY